MNIFSSRADIIFEIDENLEILKQPFKAQAGRCFNCAQPFKFYLEGYNFRTKAFHCHDCQKEELEEMIILLNLPKNSTKH